VERKIDILVAGGGPAGVISAVTAHKYYLDKKIILMKSIEKGVIPCGIPYMISSLKDPEENKLSTASLEKMGIEVIVDEITKIDPDKKVVITKSEDVYGYEKLILAIGSKPTLPPIPGIDKKGVYPVYKDLDYLKGLVEDIKRCRNVLVLGGGFIGIEFADEISKVDDAKIYLAEMLPNLLANSFDPEFSELAKKKLEEEEVNILTGIRVEEFIGGERVEKVRLSNGNEIEIGCVVLGIGTFPNVELAQDAGLDAWKGKGIWVDEYMRTTDPDIFAVGDCAIKRDFFTRKGTPVMLASTATAEARIAGSNLYRLQVVRENKGTIGIYSTYVNGLALGSAGLTENRAKKEGFDVVVGNAEAADKHPSTMPNVNKMKVKLLFSRYSGIIMGGQVAGGTSCGELINAIGIAIQKRSALSELETLQMATHPCLTSAPTIYPLVLAAQDAGHKLRWKK